MNRIKLIAGGTLAGFVLLYLLTGLNNIEPGEVGVLVKTVGDNRGMQVETLGTGMHWMEPFVYDVIVYDTRLRQEKMDNTPANTQDGQPILIDISFDVSLVDKDVPALHQKVGHDYYNQLVFPAARAAVRNFAAEQTSDTIYTGAGRIAVQTAITGELTRKLTAQYGIAIAANLRDVQFENKEFVATLERKARAQQEVTIQQRQAEAAQQEALKVQNVAEGEKFKTVQAAEGERERLRLQGEGERLQKEEIAKGNLALQTADAEGTRLKNAALSGAGGRNLVEIEWAHSLGPKLTVWGLPVTDKSNTIVMDAMRGVSINAGGN